MCKQCWMQTTVSVLFNCKRYPTPTTLSGSRDGSVSIFPISKEFAVWGTSPGAPALFRVLMEHLERFLQNRRLVLGLSTSLFVLTIGIKTALFLAMFGGALYWFVTKASFNPFKHISLSSPFSLSHQWAYWFDNFMSKGLLMI